MSDPREFARELVQELKPAIRVIVSGSYWFGAAVAAIGIRLGVSPWVVVVVATGFLAYEVLKGWCLYESYRNENDETEEGQNQ